MRWARRDSERFRTEHPLPQPFLAPDLTPFTGALRAAQTPAEFSYVLNALLDATGPFLNEVLDCLGRSVTRQREHRNAEPGSPPARLRDAASHIGRGLSMAFEADLGLLRAHYDPPPSLEASRPERPTPPTPPLNSANSPRPPRR
ncbi:hypothetical protein [Streptomyces sp. NPDC096324]|uniref:hypothetical protein n=1 Tax=Streptomyces sp. NPDC096324 TaxID=3366085 RepID=UPI003813CCF5